MEHPIFFYPLRGICERKYTLPDANGRLISDQSIGVRNADVLEEPHRTNTPKIIGEDVITTNGESKALSKENFAQNILNDVFKDVSFEGFRGVFDRLKRILSEDKNT